MLYKFTIHDNREPTTDYIFYLKKDRTREYVTAYLNLIIDKYILSTDNWLAL